MSSGKVMKCIVLPKKQQARDWKAEIRPFQFNRTSLDSRPGNNTHKTELFFYELPRLPTATMEVRRITIGGNFFGGEFGYLDVEAEACIEIKKSNTCLDIIQRIF